MSASRERKKRTEQDLQPVPAAKKAKKKLSEGWIFAICVVAVFALIVVGIIGYRAIARNRTVLSVGDTDISTKEFNYFYSSTARSLGSYASYFGIDAEKALDEQNVSLSGASMASAFGMDTACLDGADKDDTEYDVTWAELVAYNARKTAVQAHAIAQEAKKAGYELDADEYEAIDAEIAELKPYADQNGETLDELIERVYGDGCNEENYRAYMELMHLAEHYPSSLEYSDEEISTFFTENQEQYEVAAYYTYQVTPSDIATAAAEDTAEDTTATTPEITDEDRAAAKKAAEDMAAAFDEKNDKVKLSADQNKAAVKNAVSEEASEWLFGEAEAGAAKLFEVTPEATESVPTPETTYYVIKLVGKEDYATMNALQIYVSADTEETGTAQADKVAAIDAALETDATEEAFRKLIAQYSEVESEDGAVENQSRSSLNSTSPELLAWVMEQRAAGDYIKVTIEATASSTGGTIYLFYTGEGESHRHLVISNALRTNWLNDLTEAALKVCDYSEGAAMGGKTDLILGTN